MIVYGTKKKRNFIPVSTIKSSSWATSKVIYELGGQDISTSLSTSMHANIS